MPEEMDEAYGPSKPMGEAKPESVDQENDEHKEIVVDKSVTGEGKKVGDTCVFKITNDYGEEFSLEYVEEGPSESHRGGMMSPEEEIDSMEE